MADKEGRTRKSVDFRTQENLDLVEAARVKSGAGTLNSYMLTVILAAARKELK